MKLQMALVDRVLKCMRSVKQDADPLVQDILKNALAKMDLVTRKEFDAQAKVLAKADRTLAELQARLEALQKKSNSQIS